MMSDRLTADLSELAVDAPRGLLPNVLVGTGIADGFVRRRSLLGDVLVAFGNKGVTALELAADPGGFVTTYEDRYGRRAIAVDRMPPRIATHLDAAIAAGRPGRLPVDLERLTQFQAAVLRTTAKIPRGEVRPYGWVAKEIGKPAAVRAVGTALYQPSAADHPLPPGGAFGRNLRDYSWAIGEQAHPARRRGLDVRASAASGPGIRFWQRRPGSSAIHLPPGPAHQRTIASTSPPGRARPSGIAPAGCAAPWRIRSLLCRRPIVSRHTAVRLRSRYQSSW
jgi:O6-methylguanine-DNA--protein-cysteine methyltransferase